MQAFYRTHLLPSAAADLRAAKLAFVTSKSRGGKVPLADFVAFFAPEDEPAADDADPGTPAGKPQPAVKPMTPQAIDRAFGKANVARRPTPRRPEPSAHA